MNRPGFNPNRRNRNIGTDRAGYGRDNRLVIPAAWADDRMYYEKIQSPKIISSKIGEIKFPIIVEPVHPGFFHSCTADDIIYFLGFVPGEHIRKITAVVLRQPKKKERILSPAWGRLVYWANIGEYSGPTIYLEAQEANGRTAWKKALDPDDAKELARLRDDGHQVATNKRRHLISSSVGSVRNTQLYRTLPHEIGHYVDYMESVEIPGKDDLDTWTSLNSRYFKRSPKQKESFAHRYAEDLTKSLKRKKKLPFSRIVDVLRMQRFGLKPEWFGEAGKASK